MLPVAAFVQDTKGRLLFLNEKAQLDWKTKARSAIGQPIGTVIGSREIERGVTRNITDVIRSMSGQVASHLSGNPHLLTLMFPVVDSGGDVVIAGLAVMTHG